jgi:5-methyltetrahydropteroyltriglutamate--homocysteine methyltransferase
MAASPPFRADQVGSLLRPAILIQARERFLGPQTPTTSLGPHTNSQLRAVEDACIHECLAMQERIGLRAVTDGESAIKGNPLTPAEQEAKLARIVETAREVWGSH